MRLRCPRRLAASSLTSGRKLELKEASAQDGSNAHKNLQTVCNDEISKLIVGQVLSSSAKNTGLGSGVANLHGEVRQDIRLYDMCRLSETLEKQLFTPYLLMNGYRGRAPSIRWGGEKEHEALALAQSVNQFRQGGLQPTDEGLQVISHRIGYDLERAPEPVGGGSLERDGGT
jgi:phage gp29-like protein